MGWVDDDELASLTSLMTPDPSVYGPQPAAPAAPADTYHLPTFDQQYPMPQASPDVSPWQPATYVPPAPIPVPGPSAPLPYTPDMGYDPGAALQFQGADTSMWDQPAAPIMGPQEAAWGNQFLQDQPTPMAIGPQDAAWANQFIANQPTPDSVSASEAYWGNQQLIDAQANNPTDYWNPIQARHDAPFGADINPTPSWMDTWAQTVAKYSPRSLISQGIAPLTDRVPGGDIANGLLSSVLPWLVPGGGLLDVAMNAPAAAVQPGIAPLALELGNAALMGGARVPGTSTLERVLSKPLGDLGGRAVANSASNALSMGGLSVAGNVAEGQPIDWGAAGEQALIGGALPLATELGIPAVKALGRELAPEGAIYKAAGKVNEFLPTPGLSLEDVSRPEDAALADARKAYTDYIAGEARIRQVGTTAREISAGRGEQASGIMTGLREGLGTGAGADEMLTRAREGAATGPLAKTFTDVPKPTAEHQAALVQDIARRADAGELTAFEALRGMKALDKVTKGEKLQPAELRWIANNFGDEAAKAIADRVESPAQSAARAAKEDAKLRAETARYNNSAVVRQEKAAALEEQRLNRELASSQETADRQGFRDKWRAITKAGNAVDEAQIADLNNALRTTPEEEQIARNAITRQANRAQGEAGRATEAVNRKDLSAKVAKLIDEKVPPEQQKTVRDSVNHWLDQNDVRLRALGDSAPNVVDRIGAFARGDLADSYLASLVRRQTELERMLTIQGTDPEIARGIAKLLGKQELKARYPQGVPAEAAAMLETAKPLAPGDATVRKGLAAFSQGIKELQFGLLDMGVFGQQVLKAVGTGWAQMIAGLTNRGLAVAHLPHVDTAYFEKGWLPKAVQYQSDGLLQSFLSGVTERDLGSTWLRRIPAAGQFIDPVVVKWTNLLNDVQFKHVLGGLRNLTYEGNLVLAHVAGQDVQDPRVRATAAAHANATTSAAYSAARSGRALAESAGLLSPSMRRAQVAQIAQVAKVFSLNATPAERALGAMTILATAGSTLAIGKLLNDTIGTGPFEFDPSKPGFGQIRLANGVIFDLFPQEQIVKAVARSAREFAEMDPVAAAKAWGNLGISSSSPALQTVEKSVGVGYQDNKGYRYGDFGTGMDIKSRILNTLPIPPVIQAVQQGEAGIGSSVELTNLGAQTAGVNSFTENQMTHIYDLTNGRSPYPSASDPTGSTHLTASQRAQFDKDHPDLAQFLADRDAASHAAGAKKAASDQEVRSFVYDTLAAAKDDAGKMQIEADRKLKIAQGNYASGNVGSTEFGVPAATGQAYIDAVNEWKDTQQSIRDKLAGAQQLGYDNILQSQQKAFDPMDPVSRYFAQIDGNKDAAGKVNWDAVDQWMANLDELDRGAVNAYLGTRGSPLQQQQFKDQQAITASGYYDSDSKGQFLRDNPDVERLVETWTPDSKVLTSNRLDDQYTGYQEQQDAAFKAGKITASQWKDNYYALQDERRAKKDELYSGYSPEVVTALDGYYAEQDANKERNGGVVSFDELSQWVAKQPQDVRDAIDGRAPGKAITPVAQQFIDDRQKIEASHYWDIPDAVFERWASKLPPEAGYTEGETKSQWMSGVQQLIYQRVLDRGVTEDTARVLTGQAMNKLMATESDVETTVRAALIKQDPATLALLVKWGYRDPSKSNLATIVGQFEHPGAVAVGQ